MEPCAFHTTLVFVHFKFSSFMAHSGSVPSTDSDKIMPSFGAINEYKDLENVRHGSSAILSIIYFIYNLRVG